MKRSLDAYLLESTGEVKEESTKSPPFKYADYLKLDRFKNQSFNNELLEDMESRRRTLFHIIKNDGWSWEDVVFVPSR